ncbi:MAG: hypothetical protein HY690_13175 [Chloroflexi bacterium]|nr:hypothetical protein [Chloroflexota bacterium]
MPEERPFIDYARSREGYEARRREMAQNPDARRSIFRARITVLHDYLKEVQIGPFRFRSDEPERMGGGGEAPQPLQYFVAAVGF